MPTHRTTSRSGSRRARMLAMLMVAGLAAPMRAQDAPPGPAASDGVNVFLDCQWECDSEFIRTEITYVNWVRDRVPADVHLLVATQATGGAGQAFTLTFIGQRRFATMADTLRYVASATNSPDETRRGLVRIMALGLARYAARTGAGARLTVSMPAAAPGATPVAGPDVDDPWNFWTFSLNGSTNFNGEQSYESRYYYMSVNANRTTKDWKTRFNVNQSQNTSRFVVPAGAGGDTAYTSFSRTLGFGALAARSITSHLSVGLRGGVTSSTYLNQRLNAFITPAVEYNIFPYEESTRRELVFQYGLGVRTFRYVDTTIFGRTTETKPIHSGTAALNLRQRWGSIAFNVRAQQYLDQPRKYNWSSFTEADVRLFKGLSLNLFVSYERIRDQIYLRADGATRDEILTRQRQLETGYNMWGHVGLNYTFGSIYNNVVNPRFRF